MLRMLMVNDEEIALFGLLKGVPWQACGIKEPVLTALDARQAMEILDTNEVDILLCDIEMPGESGIQFLRQIREKGNEVACIFLTCHAKFEYAQEAVKLGCLDYILVPAPYEDIARTVTQAVSHIVQEREARQAQKYGQQWLKDKQDQLSTQQGDWRNPTLVAEETVSQIISNLSDQDLSVASLAKQSHLNADYLNRIFKREKGLSIRQYIIRERMALAARLLKDASLSITSLAEFCGYANPSYFITSFKQHFGQTPMEYQEMLRSQN